MTLVDLLSDEEGGDSPKPDKPRPKASKEQDEASTKKRRLVAESTSSSSSSETSSSDESSDGESFPPRHTSSRKAKAGKIKEEFEEDDDDDSLLRAPSSRRKPLSDDEEGDSAVWSNEDEDDASGEEEEDGADNADDQFEEHLDNVLDDAMLLDSSPAKQRTVVELNESDDDAEDKETKKKIQDVLNEMRGLDSEEARLKEELSRIESSLATIRSLRDACKRKLASFRGDESKNKTWSSEAFPHSRALREALKRVFGFGEYRPMQLEVMNATMSRRDCFVVLPTGAGKSLLFQLPAIVEGGITIVISPLLSLSRDQVLNLTDKKIEAVMVSSEQSKEELKQCYARIFSGDPSLRLVYVTPEMLVKSKKFVSGLESLNRKRCLTRIVLDEAHCCSTMGHDFRPDYQKLFFIKRQFPNVPLLCVTATATVDVEEDCRRVLMQEALDNSWLVFRTSANRRNLYYEITEKKASAAAFQAQLRDMIGNRFKGKSGIIYCFSRKDTETCAKFLSEAGLSVRPYHAMLGNEEKRRTHERWRSGHVKVVCATTAFGMGIDKPDVDFIVHATLSSSVESYAQETGRAGRDGRPAECVLLYRPSDVFKVMQLNADKPTGVAKVMDMVRVCEETMECRRKAIVRSFGEVLQSGASSLAGGRCCDVCDAKAGGKSDDAAIASVDVTAQAESLLRRFLESRRSTSTGNVTFTQLIDAWRETKSESLFRQPPKWTRAQCEQLGMRLLLEGVLKIYFQYTSYGALAYIQEGDRANALLRQFKSPRALQIRLSLVQKPEKANGASSSAKKSQLAMSEKKTSATKAAKSSTAAASAAASDSRLGRMLTVQKKAKTIAAIEPSVEEILDEDEEEEEDDFEAETPTFRRRTSPARAVQFDNASSQSSADAGNASAGNASAGNASAGNASAGNASTGNASAGNASTGNASAGNASTGNASAGNASAGKPSTSSLPRTHDQKPPAASGSSIAMAETRLPGPLFQRASTLVAIPAGKAAGGSSGAAPSAMSSATPSGVPHMQRAPGVDWKTPPALQGLLNRGPAHVPFPAQQNKPAPMEPFAAAGGASILTRVAHLPAHLQVGSSAAARRDGWEEEEEDVFDPDAYFGT